MRKVLTIVLASLLLTAAPACAKGKKRSGNPIFPGMYADPEVAVMGGKYWVFPGEILHPADLYFTYRIAYPY